MIKTSEIFSFLPLINNSVTTGLTFFYQTNQLSYHENQSVIRVFHLDCIIQYFYKHHPYHLSIQ